MNKSIKKFLTTVIAAGAIILPVLAPAAANAQVSVANAVCGGASLNASTNAQVCPTSDTTDTTLNNVIKTVINLFSLLVGFISVVMIIFGGFKYITSGGDGGKITSAKNTILYALIGLVIVAVAQVIVRVVLVKSITTIV